MLPSGQEVKLSAANDPGLLIVDSSILAIETREIKRELTVVNGMLVENRLLEQWIPELALEYKKNTTIQNTSSGQSDETPEALQQLLLRCRYLAHHQPTLTQSLPLTVQDWLAITGSEDAKALAALLPNPIRREASPLVRYLPHALQVTLHDWVPEGIATDRGRTRWIRYPANPQDPPDVDLRIQEAFKFPRTPTVLKGLVPMRVHLLSPAERPMQVTCDLASFWKKGYAEVRKELRARYPKHAWPEDPFATN